jgi:hypothetical protein
MINIILNLMKIYRFTELDINNLLSNTKIQNPQNPQKMRIIREGYFFKSNKIKHDKEKYAPNHQGYQISYDPKVEKK